MAHIGPKKHQIVKVNISIRLFFLSSVATYSLYINLFANSSSIFLFSFVNEGIHLLITYQVYFEFNLQFLNTYNNIYTIFKIMVLFKINLHYMPRN